MGLETPEDLLYLQQQKKEMDDVLASSMQQLSVEERQLEQEDLHGVADRVEECPEQIEQLLQQLKLHLNNFTTTTKNQQQQQQKQQKGKVYQDAKATGPGYVSDPAFRLMFLRCNRYDSQIVC